MTTRSLAVLLLASTSAAGCYEPRESPQPLSSLSCAGCHGDATGAPPPGLGVRGSRTEPTDPGVGAHAAHLSSKLGAKVACATCHQVPASIDDPGHLDSPPPAEVTFAGRAAAAGRKPTYGDGSCASTYCHSLDGAGDPAPRWASAKPVVCGSCHGLPPARGGGEKPHPPSALADCRNCHPAVVNAAGQIIAPSRHVDGVVDFN